MNTEDCDIAPLRNCFLTLVCYFKTIHNVLKIDTFVYRGFVTLGPCPLSEEHNCYIKCICHMFFFFTFLPSPKSQSSLINAKYFPGVLGNFNVTVNSHDF